MNFQFNQKYANRANKSIAMIAMNGIIGDSRVLKTAQTLKKMGYYVTLFGVSKFGFKEIVSGHPFNIILLPNPTAFIQKSDFQDEQAFLKAHTIHYAKSLLSEIGSNAPDILHTHDMRGLVIGSFFIKNLKNKQKPVWIHDLHEYTQGYNVEGANEKMFELFASLERKHIHEPDALLTVSPSLADLLGGLYNTSLDVVLNTPRKSDFDPDLPDIRSNLGLDKTVPLAVYSGNTNPMRGVEMIIKALPLIPELHIAFITNKTDSFIESLKLQAANLGVRKRVHFHPYVKFNQVTSFLRSADLGIHPVKRYLNAEIALPTKLFEYIHAGLPVVVSDNKTMADFVNKNKCGEVFKVGDLQDLVRSIKKVLSTPKDNFTPILEDLAQQYSWEKQEKVFDKMYSSLKLFSDRKISYSLIVGNPKSQAQAPQSLLIPKAIDLDRIKLHGLSKKYPLKIAFTENKLTLKALKAISKKHLIRPIKDFSDLVWADIVIDDLNFGWYSGAAIQSMALGRIVVSRIDDDLKHYLPFSYPIINASTNNLAKKIEHICDTWIDIVQKGIAGRQFVEANHSKASINFLEEKYLLKNELEIIDWELSLDNSSIRASYEQRIDLLEQKIKSQSEGLHKLKDKLHSLRQAYAKRSGSLGFLGRPRKVTRNLSTKIYRASFGRIRKYFERNKNL